MLYFWFIKEGEEKKRKKKKKKNCCGGEGFPGVGLALLAVQRVAAVR
jgi:hypothetical protein